MIKVEIHTENIQLPYKKVSKRFVSAIVTQTLRYVDMEHVLVTVIITDNDFIRQLNRDYRNKDKPTDVISFSNRDNPFPVIDGAAEDLGDIYLSIEKAAEQAIEYAVTIGEECARLLVHGLLHLLGYDHELSKAEERRMFAKEKEIMEYISRS